MGRAHQEQAVSQARSGVADAVPRDHSAEQGRARAPRRAAYEEAPQLSWPKLADRIGGQGAAQPAVVVIVPAPGGVGGVGRAADGAVAAAAGAVAGEAPEAG